MDVRRPRQIVPAQYGEKNGRHAGDVGRGKLAPADLPGLFDLRDRSKSGATMPPEGLCLESVEYPDPANSLGGGDVDSTVVEADTSSI